MSEGQEQDYVWGLAPLTALPVHRHGDGIAVMILYAQYTWHGQRLVMPTPCARALSMTVQACDMGMGPSSKVQATVCAIFPT